VKGRIGVGDVLTRCEAWFAGEVEQGGYGGAEDVGVEDAGFEAFAGEAEGEVYFSGV